MKSVIFEIVDNEGKTKEQFEFRCLKDACKHDKFKDIGYVQLREIYLCYSGKRVAKHYDYLNQLIKKLRIKEKPKEILF